MAFCKIKGRGTVWVPKPILDKALAQRAEKDKVAAQQNQDKTDGQA